MTCRACGQPLTPDQALAFWPVRDPSRVAYVHRPGDGPMPGGVTCMRAVVGPANVHRIALATEGAIR